MRLTLKYSLLTMMLSSCAEDPCKRDSFFCGSEENRVHQLKRLSDSRLIAVTIINYELFKPPLEDYAKEIARREERGLKLLMIYVRQEDSPDGYLVSDVARQFRWLGSEPCSRHEFVAVIKEKGLYDRICSKNEFRKQTTN